MVVTVLHIRDPLYQNNYPWSGNNFRKIITIYFKIQN